MISQANEIRTFACILFCVVGKLDRVIIKDLVSLCTYLSVVIMFISLYITVISSIFQSNQIYQ